MTFVARSFSTCCLLAQVLHHVFVGISLFSKVGDAHAACPNDFLCIAVTVNLAKPSPFAKRLVIRNVDYWDVLLARKPLHELLVGRFVTGLRQKYDLRFPCINVLRYLMQTTDNTI